MNAALLVVLASNVAVAFGWQPMPDGSASYEYVVQLEPELLAALEEGHAVPVASEVPAEIQPIGRIRIVVGRGALPRQKLVTRFKPLPQGVEQQQSRQGVVETQYTVPSVQRGGAGGVAASGDAAARYSDPNAVARGSAANSNLQASGDAFAQALRKSAQQARELTQNAGQNVRADVQHLFGGEPLRQQPLRRVGQAVEHVGEQVYQGLERGVQPLRATAEQAGQQLRGAAENIGQRAREIVDPVRRPLGERSILGNSQNPPPVETSTAPAFDNRGVAPGPGPASVSSNPSGHPPHMKRLDEPVEGGRGNGWPTAGGDAAGRYSESNGATRYADANGAARNSDAAQDPRSSSNHPPQQEQPDRYGPPPLLPPSQPTEWPRAAAGDPSDVASPPSRDTEADAWVGGARSPSPSNPPAGPFVTPTPAIRRDMLNQPADADLHSASGQPAFATSSPSQPPTAARPAAPPQAADFGWDTAQLAPHNRAAQTAAPASESSGSVFPLILAWVLLSGSGAGNLYLFWSYLDVRNKYRSLVRGATRQLGGRQTED